MLKYIPLYPLDCQLDLLRGFGNKKLLTNIIHGGGEKLYSLDDRPQMVHTIRNVKYYEIRTPEQFEEYVNMIEEYIKLQSGKGYKETSQSATSVETLLQTL